MRNFRIHYFRHFNLFFALMSIFCVISQGFADDEKIFQLDYANFMGEDTSHTRLELYCQFSNADLHFVKNDSGYLAQIELVAALYTDEGVFVAESAESRSFFESFYSLTTAETEKKTIQFNFEVKPAPYTLHLLFTDEVTDNTFEHKTNLNVRRFPSNELALSDIEVASAIKNPDTTTVEMKNGKKIIAQPCRIFGDIHLRAHFYFEVYNVSYDKTDNSRSVIVKYSVKDKRREIIQSFSDSFLLAKNGKGINFSVDVRKFKPGKYHIDLDVVDSRTNESIHTHTDFEVVEPPEDLPLARYDRVLNVLNLLVKDKTAKSKLEKEREKSVVALKMTKGTFINGEEKDVQLQFQQRIVYANKAFAAMGKPGWKTDRGKIFIQYGKPDRVKKLKGNTGARIEVWQYFEKDLDLMFIDQQGLGDYLLIHNEAK